MKYFLVLAAVAVLISGLNAAAVKDDKKGDDKKHKIREAYKTCAKQNNVSESEMEAAWKSNFANATFKFNCISDCVGNQMGTIKNGAIVDSEMLKNLQDMKMNQTAAQSALNTCKPKYAGANNCDKAKNFWACIRPLMPQHSDRHHGSDKKGSDKKGAAKSFKNVQSAGAKSENADKKDGKKSEKSGKHGKHTSTTKAGM